MSERPTQCKFCGNSFSVLIGGLLTFRCSSEWCPQSETWIQRSGCELNILRAKIGRAVELLQKAQRYDLDPHGDYYQGEGMVHCDTGDWIPIDDVVRAIQILQEGQQ